MTKPPTNPSRSTTKTRRSTSKSKSKQSRRSAQSKYAPVLKLTTIDDWTSKLDELMAAIKLPHPNKPTQSAENNLSIRSLVPLSEFCNEICISLRHCLVGIKKGRLSADQFHSILFYFGTDKARRSFVAFCYFWVKISQLANGVEGETASKQYRILTSSLGSFCEMLLKADLIAFGRYVTCSRSRRL